VFVCALLLSSAEVALQRFVIGGRKEGHSPADVLPKTRIHNIRARASIPLFKTSWLEVNITSNLLTYDSISQSKSVSACRSSFYSDNIYIWLLV